MKNIFIIAALLLLAFYGYQKFQAKQPVTDASTVTPIDVDDIPPTYNDHSPAPQVVNARNYTCDGRMHCSQMTSCEEATYFIKHCPSTKMDGDNDGIPCESQFC